MKVQVSHESDGAFEPRNDHCSRVKTEERVRDEVNMERLTAVV